MTPVVAVEKSLLARRFTRLLRGSLGVVAVAALFCAGSVEAMPLGTNAATPGISVVSEGSSERWIVALGGVLVAALSPELPESEQGLLLLVRPAREALGSRRLLRLRLAPEPRLELLAEGLSGWIDALAALELDPDSGPHLLAGGPGRVVDLGALAGLEPRPPAADGGAEGKVPPLVERPLLAAAGLGLHALAGPGVRRGVERGVAAIEPGRVRFWESTGGGELKLAREIAVPFSVRRTSVGLRLASPPVALLRSGLEEHLLAGPQAVGSTRLRSVWIDAVAAGAEPAELWAALPGPEAVAQSWPFEIDGVPVLVVRTQAADELNLFERQRLRVLPLAADRTRAGALPTLAVELDSKRWHTTAVALGDVDGDGHEDLLAAFPEGLSGSDLVVEWWRGKGGGRFESRAHRSDIPKAPAGWVLVPQGDASGRPGVLLVGNGRMELRSFSASGRGALTDRSVLAASLPVIAPPAGPKAPRQVTVAVGSGGESAKVTNEEPAAEPLGTVELDRRPGPELLAVQEGSDGRERLILLRRRSE